MRLVRISFGVVLLVVVVASLSVTPFAQELSDEVAPTTTASTTTRITTTARSRTTTTTTTKKPKSAIELIKSFVNTAVEPYMKSVLRLVLEAEVSADCQIALARFGAAARNLEPWSSRLIDSSSFISSGLFQGTLSQIGAYDECIETVLHDDESGKETLRAQYCTIYMKTNEDNDFMRDIENMTALSHPRTPLFISFQRSEDVPGLRLGMCLLEGCSVEDLQKLADKIGPPLQVKLTIGSCVDNRPKAIDNHQICALLLLSFVVTLVVAGTIIDFCTSASPCLPLQRTLKAFDDEKKPTANDPLWRRIMLCFSARANNRLLFQVNCDPNSEAYAYRFLHGIRFFSMYGVILGHAFSAFDFGSMSRLVNALHYGEQLWFCIVVSGYLCVDTFLFMGGFLLAYNLNGEQANRTVASVAALVRRFVRGTVPALFIMVILFLVPVILDGPKMAEWYSAYQKQFRNDWLAVTLQYLNYNPGQFDHGGACMGHLWYLSVDYQLFFVVVITLALTKCKAKSFHWMMTCYSVACVLFTGIYIHNTNYTPFVLPMAEDWNVIKLTLFNFYLYTTTHACMFFMGASTFFLVRDYRKIQLSPLTCSALWFGAIICMLIAVFGTYPWNSGNYPGEAVKVLYTMAQRPMWAGFLMWVVFACVTGRAKSVTHMLSSPSFVPLSRLTYGVYIFNLPLYFIEIMTARERIFFSAASMISRSFSMMVWCLLGSYVLFLLVEAPLGRLDKLVLERLRRRSPAAAAATNDVKACVEYGQKEYPMTPTNGANANVHVNNAFKNSQEQIAAPMYVHGHSIKL